MAEAWHSNTTRPRPLAAPMPSLPAACVVLNIQQRTIFWSVCVTFAISYPDKFLLFYLRPTIILNITKFRNPPSSSPENLVFYTYLAEIQWRFPRGAGYEKLAAFNTMTYHLENGTRWRHARARAITLSDPNHPNDDVPNHPCFRPTSWVLVHIFARAEAVYFGQNLVLVAMATSFRPLQSEMSSLEIFGIFAINMKNY